MHNSAIFAFCYLNALFVFKIKVPYSLNSDVKGFEFISTIYPNVLSQSEKEATIDFSRCFSIDANLAAALGAILDKLVEDGYKIWLTRPSERKVRTVLSRNHFLRAWGVDTNTEDRENYVEYHRFHNKDSLTFKQYIDSGLIHKQKFPEHTELVGNLITENIYEIYANAIMHGETEYVYSCGEYKENERTLEMTIVDCGRTIPGNVNTFFSKKGLPSVSPCDAIRWAFVSGNTTKEQTGGLGLAILKDFISMNSGSIQVISGKGMIEYHGDKVEQFLLNVEFPGTIVNMKFNFDDPKRYFMESEKENINLNDLL